MALEPHCKLEYTMTECIISIMGSIIDEHSDLLTWTVVRGFGYRHSELAATQGLCLRHNTLDSTISAVHRS
jgi:hypothetical protein